MYAEQGETGIDIIDTPKAKQTVYAKRKKGPATLAATRQRYIQRNASRNLTSIDPRRRGRILPPHLTLMWEVILEDCVCVYRVLSNPCLF